MCIICLLFLDNNIEKSRAATGKGNNINKKRLNAKQCIIHRPVVRQACVCVCVHVLLFVCSAEQSSPARLRAGMRERVRARAADAADCCKFISGPARRTHLPRGFEILPRTVPLDERPSGRLFAAEPARLTRD